jgi:hypothetical protein
VKHTDMVQLDIFKNIYPFKLSRKGDPETSRNAAFATDVARRRAFVLNLIQQAGARGTTIKEMTNANPNVPTSSISSRPNELEKLGLIFYLGDKRDGARVIRDIKYKEEINESSARA